MQELPDGENRYASVRAKPHQVFVAAHNKICFAGDGAHQNAAVVRIAGNRVEDKVWMNHKGIPSEQGKEPFCLRLRDREPAEQLLLKLVEQPSEVTNGNPPASPRSTNTLGSPPNKNVEINTLVSATARISGQQPGAAPRATHPTSVPHHPRI